MTNQPRQISAQALWLAMGAPEVAEQDEPKARAMPRASYPVHANGWAPYLLRVAAPEDAERAGMSDPTAYAEWVRYAPGPEAVEEAARELERREGVVVLSIADDWGAPDPPAPRSRFEDDPQDFDPDDLAREWGR